MRLVEERESWREQFEKGEIPFLIEKYKRFRNTENDRYSRALEMVCEYALWLEERQ